MKYPAHNHDLEIPRERIWPTVLVFCIVWGAEMLHMAWAGGLL